jgi:hypothetical protein
MQTQNVILTATSYLVLLLSYHRSEYSFYVTTYILFTLFYVWHKKDKSIPVTDRRGPQGCETSRFPHFLDNRLTDGGEVVVLRAGRSSPQGKFLVHISVQGWVDPRAIVRLEGLGQFKNPMTSSGFEPPTFRLVAFFFIWFVRLLALRPLLAYCASLGW